MIKDMAVLLAERSGFFLGLLVEHLEISLIAILIAIVFGGIVGILISEFDRSAKPTLAVINFLYTIPSISMLGFLIPFSGVGNATAVIALTIYALLPMVRSTHTGISTNNAAMTMAGSLLIAMLALVVDFILGIVEKRMQKRMQKRSARSKKTNRLIGAAAVIICLCLIITTVFRTQGKDTIRIATKPMTEQYVIGEMLDILIEQDTDLDVELTQGVGGGTSNIQPAMESSEFDIYPEYTGTAWNMVMKEEGLYTEGLFDTMQQYYNDELGMDWIGMYGFNNTYGLVVRREIAEQYDLKTYSDLSAVSDQLTFGAEYDFFEREDGYDALCNTYNLNFRETMDLDIGLKYQAVNQGQIDVMVIFTTDGQLSASDVVVLEDDQHFYPSYLCGNVIRSEVLEEHPELEGVFEKVTGIISDRDMAAMNYEVETEGKEPRGCGTGVPGGAGTAGVKKKFCGQELLCKEMILHNRAAPARRTGMSHRD